jgi:hypothetical protein
MGECCSFTLWGLKTVRKALNTAKMLMVELSRDLLGSSRRAAEGTLDFDGSLRLCLYSECFGRCASVEGME